MFETYFSARYILSLGASLNQVLSRRSDGKTFDCKLRALEDYRDNKEITIYARRFKTEFTEQLCNHFFDELVVLSKYAEFASWEFKGSKKGVKVKQGDEWDWIIMFCPLSTSSRMKSQLDPFIRRIRIIDYDEFVPLDGVYLPNEVKTILELYKSIDRDRDVVQLIMLGNKITDFMGNKQECGHCTTPLPTVLI